MHLYIHIPFCLSKCRYCAFASIAISNVPEQRYVSAVLKEAEICSREEIGKNHFLDTIYIGGGTPTIMSTSQLGRLIDGINAIWPFKENAEISIESNPETLNRAYASDLKKTGVNRVSLGVQTFSERLLKYLGRIHTAKKAANAFSYLRDAGFDNINIDLMYGIPTQTMRELAHDLAWIAKLCPEHVSAYLLQHEPGTLFEEVPQCPENIGERFFYKVIECLKAVSLYQYEISNFARKSFECRHNLAYWDYCRYLGLGAAAVSSTQQGIRWKNIEDPFVYMAQIEEGGSPIETKENLTAQEIAFERRFLSLRTIKGINVASMPHGIPQDLYEIKNGKAILTPKGMLVSNEIFSKL